jgi:GntR family transcriptional regulator, transcriptional repressor for pyruvate dehydrogenase complex
MAEGVVFERLTTQKIYMQIARQVRNLIRDGTLKVGTRLPPERDLVHQFGASRASVREALSALEMLGLIECRGGQGNFIKADGSDGTIDGDLLRTLLQDHDPYEIFEARLEMEPTLAALAAERATADERERLSGHVERLKELGIRIRTEADAEPAIEEYMEEDRKLHLEICRAAHNNVLFTVFAGVNLMMKETHWKAMKSKGLHDPANVEAYAVEHAAILEAVLARNAKAAGREARRHLTMLKRTLFD